MSRYSFDPSAPGGAKPPGYWSERVWQDMWVEKLLQRKMELAKSSRAHGHTKPRRFMDVIAEP